MNSFKMHEMKIGQKDSFIVEVTERMMTSFQNISGDDNPLHLNIDFAISSGFKDRVVYGLLTSSFYSRLIGVYLPGKYALLMSIKIDFIKPVFIKDKMTVVGEVVEIDERFKFIIIHSKILRNKNEEISNAQIRVGFNEQ